MVVEYRPWTWEIPESSADMRRTITRQDAQERVGGQAVFARDVYLPGMLYAKILLSPYAHARSTPAGVEPIVCVAQWRGDFLDLWIHHQDLPLSLLSTPTAVREKPQPAVAEWTKITVTMPYQGSWYGGFSWLAYSYAFIRLAAKFAKRAGGNPVKLLWDESGYYCGGDDAGQSAESPGQDIGSREKPSSVGFPLSCLEGPCSYLGRGREQSAPDPQKTWQTAFHL